MSGDQDKLDGFDLLEFPLKFEFKAMCSTAVVEDTENAVMQLIEDQLSADRIHSSKQRGSRSGKYVSVSVLVTLLSRAELEAVYLALSNSDFVIMTL